MLIGFERISPNAPARVKLTEWYTDSPYIHVELFFETMHNAGFSARVSTNGLTLEPFDKIVENPKDWVFYRVPVWNEQAVISYLSQYAGLPFSFRNIASMVTGLNLVNAEARFCSELAYEAISKFSITSVPYAPAYTVTPAKLLQIVKNAKFQAVVI